MQSSELRVTVIQIAYRTVPVTVLSFEILHLRAESWSLAVVVVARQTCLTKTRSEFRIVSGFLLFWHVHGFFSFNRELSKLGSSFAGYQHIQINQGVGLESVSYLY